MPRRGLPVAAIEVPRWYRPVVVEERQPSGSNPRGPLRGGPGRSAGDPQRTPHDSLCGGPVRSSDDPRLSKTTQAKAKREAKGEKGSKRLTVITVDKDGREACCRPLARQAAWRACRLWEDMRGEVHVFLEKDGQRKEVQVEKRVGKGKPIFWFVEEPQPPQDQEGRDDQPTPEKESPAMDEARPDEVQTERTMWMSERVMTLQNENEELKKTVQEMAPKIQLH